MVRQGRPRTAVLIYGNLAPIHLRHGHGSPTAAWRRLVEDHDQHDSDRTLDALRGRRVDRQRGPVDELPPSSTRNPE